MKRKALIGHLIIPGMITFGAFAVALTHQPLGWEMFSNYIFGGYLYYAAPHLFWAVVAAVTNVQRTVWHAGFIASSIALTAIASVWLGPQDQSGLPLQWMLYWPLAIALQFFIAGGTAIYYRVKKTPNSSIKKADTVL
ncbi:hypothetical protein JCM14076_26820 [Methylosoma difficile]